MSPYFCGRPEEAEQIPHLSSLEAQVVICVTTEFRKQTPKALFCVAFALFPLGEKKLFCIYKDLILEIGSCREITLFPWVLGSGKTWVLGCMLSWLLCKWIPREVQTWLDWAKGRRIFFVSGCRGIGNQRRGSHTCMHARRQSIELAAEVFYYLG